MINARDAACDARDAAQDAREAVQASEEAKLAKTRAELAEDQAIHAGNMTQGGDTSSQREAAIERRENAQMERDKQAEIDKICTAWTFVPTSCQGDHESNVGRHQDVSGPHFLGGSEVAHDNIRRKDTTSGRSSRSRK